MPKNDDSKTKTQELMILKEETADLVLKKVQSFQNQGELELPANYSAANALKSAWLVLQGVVDKNKKPALEVCTKPSIANALLSMVIQGLNPAKSQCYFIVYGNTLTMSPSYQGRKATCLRVDDSLLDIYAETVYEGDELVYSIVLGQRMITQHSQSIDNIDENKIKGAYAIAVDKKNKPRRTELMTLAELKQAWAQSPINPITDKGHIKASTTHAKFTSEMAKKTVTNRLTKHIIGSSDDRNLVVRAVKAAEEDAARAEAQEEVDALGNTGDIIDIKPKSTKSTKPASKNPPPPQESEPDFDGPEANGGEMSDEEKEEIRRQEEKDAAAEAAAAQAGPGF